MTFASFVLNDHKEYKNDCDPITLMVGYVAMSFICSIYLNL